MVWRKRIKLSNEHSVSLWTVIVNTLVTISSPFRGARREVKRAHKQD